MKMAASLVETTAHTHKRSHRDMAHTWTWTWTWTWIWWGRPVHMPSVRARAQDEEADGQVVCEGGPVWRAPDDEHQEEREAQSRNGLEHKVWQLDEAR